MYVRCVPEGTNVPDLTVGNEIDTMNGFSPTVFTAGTLQSSGPANYLNEKFRFRRKCDDNTDINLLAQHTNTQGSGRVVNIIGLMQAIIRVR